MAGFFLKFEKIFKLLDNILTFYDGILTIYADI